MWKLELVIRILTMPSMVQLVTKLVNPPRGGTSLEIIPLLIHTFTIPIPITTIDSQLVEGSERSDKKQNELVNPTHTILDSRL